MTPITRTRLALGWRAGWQRSGRYRLALANRKHPLNSELALNCRLPVPIDPRLFVLACAGPCANRCAGVQFCRKSRFL